MSSISLDGVSDIFDRETPFCDKDCKSARLAIDFVNAACSALFYKIISTAYILGRTRHSNEMHRYYALRASNEKDKIRAVLLKCFTYKRYGSEIVDFSENGGARLNDMITNTHLKIWQKGRSGKTLSERESQTLQFMYGPEIVDHWNRNVGMQIHFQHLGLKRGCCLGMSLDFISSYLREQKSGKSSLECIMAIAPRFAQGASEQAQMAQLSQEAWLEPYVSDQSQIGQLNRWFRQEKDKVSQLPPKDRIEALQDLVREFYQKIACIAEDVPSVDMALLKDLTKGFAFEPEDAMYRFDISHPSDRSEFLAFSDFVHNVEPGVFVVFLRDKNLSGHAIVFIKTEEGKDFIFDPNRATLAVDPAQSAIRLIEITRSIRFSSLAFVPIALN